MALDKRLLGRFRQGQSGYLNLYSDSPVQAAAMALYNARWLVVSGLFMVAYIAGFIYLSTAKDFPVLKEYSTIGIVVFLIGLLVGFLLMLGQISRGASSGIFPSMMDDDVLSSAGRLGVFVAVILLAIALTFSLVYLFSGDNVLSTTMMYMIITGVFIVAGVALVYGTYRRGQDSGFFENVIDFVQHIGRQAVELWVVIKDIMMPILRDIYTTPRYVMLLMAGIIVFLLGWFFLPTIINELYSVNGTVLQKEAVSMNHATSLGTFENLSSSSKVPPKGRGVRRGGVETNVPSDGEFNYRYSLSAWIFLNQQSSSPDSGGGFQNLLNYGEKPSIQYDANTKTLRIITREGMSDIITLYESNSIPLQRWNHFVINYENGRMDVFLNGSLVATKRGVVPYMKNDNVIIGQQAGVEGGCANVVYYKEPLSWWSIQAIYNSLKSLSVPYI